MVSSVQPKMLVIRKSKIVHKSATLHQLARFVTEEAVCLMFRIDFENIYTVECWRHIVYIHGKGVSKFVSYADFPPIVGVVPPTALDCGKWRKRWRKTHDYAHRKLAPHWWAVFFTNEFCQASSELVLSSWGQLVELIKFAFTEDTLEELRRSYHREKSLLSGSVVIQQVYY